MTSTEFMVVGAGPGGLCAAYTLARAGREVLVLEGRTQIGPKTCGGGLSVKAVRFLEEMGLPGGMGCDHVSHASFLGEDARPLDPRVGVVRTLSRGALGQWQAQVTRNAGATIRAGNRVEAVDLAGKQVVLASGQRVRYRYLIGADGSRSVVRRAIGYRSRCRYFAVECHLPREAHGRLLVSFDSRALRGGGYFWMFPHQDYVSTGCGVDRARVAPRDAYRYLKQRLASLGLADACSVPKAAVVETDYMGLGRQEVRLVGDAAGLASPLTGEGIYGALISGRAAALSLLDFGHHDAALQRWARTRALHQWIAAAWGSQAVLRACLLAMRTLCRWPGGRRALTSLFLA